jgi:hypothetical protein
MIAFNPFMLWVDFAFKAMEMFVASGQVITERVDRMVRAGANPSPADLREFHLMGAEKVRAAGESAFAVAMRLSLTQQQRMWRAWQQWGPLSAETARLANAALRPIHGTATANARRLTRNRKRAAPRR